MDFEFLDYSFEQNTARFRYQGKDNVIFTETVDFAPKEVDYDPEVLDSALFLAFITIGTSYYKADPTTSVKISRKLTPFQADFFNKIYQEGLGQFAFENNLTRDHLAHFISNDANPSNHPTFTKEQSLILLSGGKESLLSTELIRESHKPFRVMYITSQKSYPTILDEFDNPIIVRRHIDKENLKRAQGLNGHVPVSLITESLGLIQAILIGANQVEIGIGKEGYEPNAKIQDLVVNHQWAKTIEAQTLMKEYIDSHITKSITLGSILANYTELEIAELFAKKCWNKYGHQFSSCNVSNYKQDEDNRELKWCGKCAKCANSYLLFAPFLKFEEQAELFGRDLFSDPEMTELFKGLLNVDGVMKPFECVASSDELRWAYKNKLPGYGNLPFTIESL